MHAISLCFANLLYIRVAIFLTTFRSKFLMLSWLIKSEAGRILLHGSHIREIASLMAGCALAANLVVVGRWPWYTPSQFSSFGLVTDKNILDNKVACNVDTKCHISQWHRVDLRGRGIFHLICCHPVVSPTKRFFRNSIVGSEMRLADGDLKASSSVNKPRAKMSKLIRAPFDSMMMSVHFRWWLTWCLRRLSLECWLFSWTKSVYWVAALLQLYAVSPNLEQRILNLKYRCSRRKKTELNKDLLVLIGRFQHPISWRHRVIGSSKLQTTLKSI